MRDAHWYEHGLRQSSVHEDHVPHARGWCRARFPALEPLAMFGEFLDGSADALGGAARVDCAQVAVADLESHH